MAHGWKEKRHISSIWNLNRAIVPRNSNFAFPSRPISSHLIIFSSAIWLSSLFKMRCITAPQWRCVWRARETKRLKQIKLKSISKIETILARENEKLLRCAWAACSRVNCSLVRSIEKEEEVKAIAAGFSCVQLQQKMYFPKIIKYPS